MLDLTTRMLHRHLDEDETLQLVVHKHWLLGVRALFVPTLVFIVVWSLLYVAPILPVFYFIAILATGVLVWWLRCFFDYYLDAWLITDQGIIDIEWHGWFHRESTRVLYSDIQGVSYEIQGVASTIMRYGTLSVEKISTGSTFSLECVGKPWQVETIILRNMEAYLHSKNLKDSKQVQELLSAIVAREISLHEFDDEKDVSDEDV